jgi:competence protein ComEC
VEVAVRRVPGLRLLLPFVAGIALCDWTGAPPVFWIVLGVVALALRLCAPAVGELLISAALGGLALALRLHAPVPDLAPASHSVTLELLEAPRRSGPLCSARVHVFGATGGRALLRATGSLCDGLPGNRIRARVRLDPFRPATNPGADSSRRRWRRRGVRREARLVDGLQAPIVTPPGARARVEQVRRRVEDAVAAPTRAGALLRALVTGRRDALDPSLRAPFVESGTAHLLAVSGLHVACVFATISWTLRRLVARAPFVSWVRIAPAFGTAAGVCAALGYALLSGLGVPALRAAAMAAAATLAIALGRPAASANALCLAALLVLVVEPASLFDPGFALSFSAVAGILVWRPPVRGVAALVHATLAAGLATAPWAAALGLPFAAGAPLANLLAVPLFGFVVVPLGLATGVVGSLAPVLGDLLRPVALGVAELALRALEGLGSPDLLATAASPGLAAGGAAVCGFALRTAWRLAEPGLGLLAAVAAIVALLALLPAENSATTSAELTFLDVGHGDAVLARSGTAAWLVDAGPRLGRFDAGLRVVHPALRALGVRRLDVLVVTHSDRDHSGGAAAILSRVPVGELWMTSAVVRHPAGRGLLRVAARHGVAVRLVARGERAWLGRLGVSVRWPPAGEAHAAGNAGSLVLRLEGPRTCALLPGDVPAPVERRLSPAEAPCASLGLAHHGSRTSSDASWLSRVRPLVAVASAGRRRRGALPHADVRARLAERDVTLYVTREHGAVRLDFTPHGLVAAPFLP